MEVQPVSKRMRTRLVHELTESVVETSQAMALVEDQDIQTLIENELGDVMMGRKEWKHASDGDIRNVIQRTSAAVYERLGRI